MYPNRTCSVTDCDGPFYCRGFCTLHYQRWRRFRSTEPRTRSIAERLAAHSVPGVDGCTVWIGAKLNNGYGHVLFRGRVQVAHRVAWTIYRGEIPDGLVIDHLCRNRACINVEHMRVVTHKVNSLAGISLPAQNAVKTHCLRGHEFTVANTWIDHHGHRSCRSCAKLRKLNRHLG